MFVSTGATQTASLIAGAFILSLTAGCSGGSERASRDTAGSSDTSVALTTGAANPADTVAGAGGATTDSTGSRSPAESSAATPTHTAAVARPATPRPPVKPSIDPGRKSTAPSSSKPSTTGTASVAPSDTATSDSSAAATTASAQDQTLKYDAATNTVTFQLIGGPTGFQFNGYSSGGATLTLPPKANVVIHFVNHDGTPHSAEVISGEGPIPNASVDPAIPRAYTRQALQGLTQGEGDDMKFTAPESGSYRITCGVPGHGLSGMWIWMKVDPAAKQPSFGPTKK